MKSEIENLDKKRLRNLELYIIGVAFFMLLSITRFFFRLGGLNSRPIGKAVLLGLILSLILIALGTVRSAILWRTIKDEPHLMEAMNDEWVQALEVRSWKAAFIAAVGTTFFFAIASSFYPVTDPVLTALTAGIAGAGAHQATFYFAYRSS
jgi:uncharacterized membrane protein